MLPSVGQSVTEAKIWTGGDPRALACLGKMNSPSFRTVSKQGPDNSAVTAKTLAPHDTLEEWAVNLVEYSHYFQYSEYCKRGSIVLYSRRAGSPILETCVGYSSVFTAMHCRETSSLPPGHSCSTSNLWPRPSKIRILRISFASPIVLPCPVFV